MDDGNDVVLRDGERKPSLARRIFGWIAGTIIALVLLLAVIRVFVATIPPDQEAPDGHFGKPCALCHLVSENAKPVEVK